MSKIVHTFREYISKNIPLESIYQRAYIQKAYIKEHTFRKHISKNIHSENIYQRTYIQKAYRCIKEHTVGRSCLVKWYKQLVYLFTDLNKNDI